VGDNIEVGIYTLRDALQKAEELELDLVEISPNAAPPVCKILDYKNLLLILIKIRLSSNKAK